MNYKINRNPGFTLVELLIVIAIMSILAVASIYSYMNSVRNTRDGRRKSDIAGIQQAVELYYEDHKAYPSGPVTIDGGHTYHICSTGGFSTSACAASDVDYMNPVPNDPNKSSYYYDSNGTWYKIYSCLEGASPVGPGVGSYGNNCNCAGGAACQFGISSSNTTP